MAGSILGALPMLLLLFFFGRKIVQSVQFIGGR
jgi:ABC-type glycerol-3-phosphate transport system permease component